MVSRLGDDAAAGREHSGLNLLDEVLQGFALQPAEIRLAVQFEDLSDRQTRLALHQRVEFIEGDVQA